MICYQHQNKWLGTTWNLFKNWKSYWKLVRQKTVIQRRPQLKMLELSLKDWLFFECWILCKLWILNLLKVFPDIAYIIRCWTLRWAMGNTLNKKKNKEHSGSSQFSYCNDKKFDSGKALGTQAIFSCDCNKKFHGVIAWNDWLCPMFKTVHKKTFCFLSKTSFRKPGSSSEAALQRSSYKKVFWKYATNLSNFIERNFIEITLYWNHTLLQSNFIEITLRHGCSPISLLHIFRTPFPWKPLEGCFCIVKLPFFL